MKKANKCFNSVLDGFLRNRMSLLNLTFWWLRYTQSMISIAKQAFSKMWLMHLNSSPITGEHSFWFKIGKKPSKIQMCTKWNHWCSFPTLHTHTLVLVPIPSYFSLLKCFPWTLTGTGTSTAVPPIHIGLGSGLLLSQSCTLCYALWCLLKCVLSHLIFQHCTHFGN